jgi:hypothetical protein
MKAAIIAAVFAAAILSGCATNTSRLDLDFGTSYNLAKYNQIANPDAEKNLEPVQGLDGEASEKLMERYRKEFAKPAEAQKPAFVFGIGTSSGSLTK